MKHGIHRTHQRSKQSYKDETPQARGEKPVNQDDIALVGVLKRMVKHHAGKGHAGENDDRGHDVFEDTPYQQPDLGFPQILCGQGPLENDLIAPPVIEIKQQHAEDGRPW